MEASPPPKCALTQAPAHTTHATPDTAGSSVDSAPELDILALLEAWIDDMASLNTTIKQLAGEAPGPTGAVAPTPLLGASGPHSHAPHLSAQLNVHRAALEQMRSLRAGLAMQLTAAGGGPNRLWGGWLAHSRARVPSKAACLLERSLWCAASKLGIKPFQFKPLTLLALLRRLPPAEASVAQLEPQVDALMADMMQQLVQEEAAAQDLAAAVMAGGGDEVIASHVAGTPRARQHGVGGASAAPAGAVASQWLAAVLGSGPLQPVPPTPLLRQMALAPADPPHQQHQRQHAGSPPQPELPSSDASNAPGAQQHALPFFGTAAGSGTGSAHKVPRLNLSGFGGAGSKHVSPLQLSLSAAEGLTAAVHMAAPSASASGRVGSPEGGGITFAAHMPLTAARRRRSEEGGTPPFPGGIAAAAALSLQPVPERWLDAAPPYSPDGASSAGGGVLSESSFVSLDVDAADDLDLIPLDEEDEQAFDLLPSGMRIRVAAEEAAAAAAVFAPCDSDGSQAGAQQPDERDEAAAASGASLPLSGVDFYSPSLSDVTWTDCAKPRRLSYGTASKHQRSAEPSSGHGHGHEMAPINEDIATNDDGGTAALVTPAPARSVFGAQAPPTAETEGVPLTLMALRERFAKMKTTGQ